MTEFEKDSEYAREQEEKHRRRIVLPSVIPWECGSNKYASQKDTGGFGRIRNTTTKIESSKELSDGNNGAVPFHSCPTMHERGASQTGDKPFGSFRSHVTTVKDHNELKTIQEILVDPKATERVLVKWAQPNPEAKNDDLYGKRRNAISLSVGGRRFTQDELNKSRGSLPRFQNVNLTAAAQHLKPGESLSTGYQPRRQVTTMIEGLNFGEQEQLDSNRYLSWLGGQISMQSQSKTGGFNKSRDVVNNNFYGKLMSEKDLTPQELYELRKKEREDKLTRTMTVGEAVHD